MNKFTCRHCFSVEAEEGDECESSPTGLHAPKAYHLPGEHDQQRHAGDDDLEIAPEPGDEIEEEVLVSRGGKPIGSIGKKMDLDALYHWAMEGNPRQKAAARRELRRRGKKAPV